MKISAFSAFSVEPGSRLLGPGSRVLVVAHLVVNLANSASSGFREASLA